MAHNINFNERTGQHSFFSVQQKAWHGLGIIVQDYPTSAEALQFAGLDFGVEKRKLFTYDSDNNSGKADLIIPEVEVPHYFATVRTDTDTALGVVGKDYEIVQNRDAFSFFDSIVGGDGIQYETAGALGKGERIFITAKLPSYIKVGKDDLLEQYLFLTTSHDGRGSITAAFTPVRIVCRNTLNAAMHRRSNSVKIRHTAGAMEKLELAHRLMGISSKLSTDLEGLLNTWTKVRVTDSEVKKLIQKAMAPNKEVYNQLLHGEIGEHSARYQNACSSVYEYAMAHPSQQLATTAGTLFGVYNAVTGYYQNVKSFKSDEAKLKSILYGGTAQLRGQAAFNACLNFANGADNSFFTN